MTARVDQSSSLAICVSDHGRRLVDVSDAPDELDEDEDDANVLGKFIVDRATGQTDLEPPTEDEDA